MTKAFRLNSAAVNNIGHFYTKYTNTEDFYTLDDSWKILTVIQNQIGSGSTYNFWQIICIAAHYEIFTLPT